MKSVDLDPDATPGQSPAPYPTRSGTPLRRSLRWLRYLPERLRHPSRRARAREWLGRLRPRDGQPPEVLFVCHGNICRSPYAAATYAQAVAARERPVRVTSAGFIGPDRRPPAEALEVASSRGFDLGGHRSSLVTPERIRSADLVVVMSLDQALSIRRRYPDVGGRVLVLGDLDPEPIERRTILDPFGRSAETFHRVYQRVHRCVEALAEVWPP